MEIIVGTAIGAIVLYLWGWRRVRYVQWYFGRAKRAEKFERGLRELREDVTGPCPYRAPETSDRELLARLPDDREILAAGFVPLGELVVCYPGKPANAAARVYADPAGTTLAMWLVTRISAAGIPLFASYAADRVFSTRRMPHVGLAQPPFVTRQLLDANLSLTDMIAKHHALCGDAALAHIATLDDVMTRLATTHDRTVAWRAQQAPDELLDADLKSVLGEAYPRAGKAWARRLRGKLPEARINS